MPTKKTGRVELGLWRAIWLSLWDKGIAYYPRVKVGDIWTSLEARKIVEEIVPRLADLSPTPEAVDEAFELASKSLAEVKSQTEYQDGKATRLLTIITFVGALSGALFGRLLDSYPPIVAIHTVSSWRLAIILGAYIGFAAFALFAACGALVTFHAIRIRFRSETALLASRDADTKSYLFFHSMLEVTPSGWANSFIAKGARTQITRDLKLRYLRNYITETYLIAAKVADKVRILEPAQVLQGLAIRVLVLWLLLVALTFAVIAPIEKSVSPNPSQQPVPQTCKSDEKKSEGAAVNPTVNGPSPTQIPTPPASIAPATAVTPPASGASTRQSPQAPPPNIKKGNGS